MTKIVLHKSPSFQNIRRQSGVDEKMRYIQEQMGKDVFEYDIYGCPTELKGQLKIGDFCGN
jgi:hypothetical protein